jgi:hypothetical protein
MELITIGLATHRVNKSVAEESQHLDRLQASRSDVIKQRCIYHNCEYDFFSLSRTAQVGTAPQVHVVEMGKTTGKIVVEMDA